MNFSASYLKNLKNNLSWDILSYFINFPSAKGHFTKQGYSKKCDLHYHISSIHHIFLAVADDFKPPELCVLKHQSGLYT